MRELLLEWAKGKRSLEQVEKVMPLRELFEHVFQIMVAPEDCTTPRNRTIAKHALTYAIELGQTRSSDYLMEVGQKVILQISISTTRLSEHDEMLRLFRTHRDKK